MSAFPIAVCLRNSPETKGFAVDSSVLIDQDTQKPVKAWTVCFDEDGAIADVPITGLVHEQDFADDDDDVADTQDPNETDPPVIPE